MHRTTPAIAACLGVLAFAPSSPAQTGQCSDAPTYERTILCLVNEERRERDLRALALSRRLAEAGDDHAADMVARGYFSHYSPEGLGPGDRARRRGYTPRGQSWMVGEALAWATGSAAPRRIVEAWIRSSGHREIVLHAQAEHIGVGAVRGTPQGEPGRTVALAVGRR